LPLPEFPVPAVFDIGIRNSKPRTLISPIFEPVIAVFTYNEQQPISTGRIPTTLVISVPLGLKPQTIIGMWSGVRGAIVN
jgi:hypothetical protein